MTNETKQSKLALALSKAQGAMKSAKRDVTNPFFKSKYADLASIWEACREQLSLNEIAVIQIPEMKDGMIGIRTKLVHSSGEFEEGFFPLAVPMTAKAQEMGSAITYLRRYSLAAMTGVAPDDDDDGTEAQKTMGQKPSTDDKNKELKQKAKEFSDSIDAASTVDLLDKCVRDNVVVTSKLSKELPDWHSKLIQKIEAKRSTWSC